MIGKNSEKASMIKLNGNIYLKIEEVEKEIEYVKKLFHTSHRRAVPNSVKYMDREFVEKIHEESYNLILSMNYLYGYGELHACVKLIIKKTMERFREKSSCDNHLFFMQYDLTDSERKKKRLLYENFLINVFLEVCIDRFKSLS